MAPSDTSDGGVLCAPEAKGNAKKSAVANNFLIMTVSKKMKEVGLGGQLASKSTTKVAATEAAAAAKSTAETITATETVTTAETISIKVAATLAA